MESKGTFLQTKTVTTINVSPMRILEISISPTYLARKYLPASPATLFEEALQSHWTASQDCQGNLPSYFTCF